MKGRTRKALMPLLLAVALLATPAVSHAQSVFMLQLGSHGSEEDAAESWNSLKAKFPDSLAKLTLRISQVALPPDNFVVFRTQAGPIKSRQEANKMCSAVLAASQECFVVETAMFVTPEKAFAEAPVTPVPPPAAQDTTPAPKITGAEPVKTAAPPPPPAPSPPPVKMAEEKPVPPPVKVAEAKPPTPPAPPPAPPKVQAAAKKELPWDAKLEPSATTLDSELKAEAPPAVRIAAPPAPPPAPPPPKQEMAAAPPPPPLPPPAPPPQKPIAAPAPPPPPVPTVSPRKANSLVTPMQLGKPIRKEDAPAPESAPPMMLASALPPAGFNAPLPPPAPQRQENEMPRVEMMPTPAPPVAQPQPAPMPPAAMQMPAPASPPPSINVASTAAPSMQPLPTMPPPPQLQESPATPGRVEVSEAVRVPLSETAKPFTNPAAAARSMTVPTANPNEKPFFGYGGFPSQTFSEATLWAQMGFFPNEQVAFAYWDKVREAYPDVTSSLRVRVTKPYMLAQRGKEGTGRVSLRIGPFASRGDLDNICGVTRQQNLECGALREMGSATADSTRGRGDDRVVGDMYRERRHNSDSPFMNSDLDDNFWAQLGTYDSPQKASTAWNGLRQAYGFVLGSLEPNVISPALSSSPKSLFRLRTGPFPTNLAAANTCNSLQRFGISCLVVAD